jgi:hypothetical protein
LILSAEFVLGPMVQMMEVLRYCFAGVYSVLSWLSHSILVLPELRWSRLLLLSAGVRGGAVCFYRKGNLYNALTCWYN